MSTTRIASALVGAVGIAIAAGVGYLLHKEARQRSEAREVVTIVQEATVELERGLKMPSQEAVAKIDGDLRVAQSWNNQELVQATEPYLVGVREILRRRADASLLTQKAAKSRAALAAHMSHSERRDTPWIRAAMALKRQVERDHFDLDVQLTALANLLTTLPEANKHLAPHVQESLLFEDSKRRGARDAVLAEAKRARDELEKARALVNYL
ncbi:MAG TPA: hypothetical protein VH600_00695 [Burkholderiales bacterium]